MEERAQIIKKSIQQNGIYVQQLLYTVNRIDCNVQHVNGGVLPIREICISLRATESFNRYKNNNFTIYSTVPTCFKIYQSTVKLGVSDFRIYRDICRSLLVMENIGRQLPVEKWWIPIYILKNQIFILKKWIK